MCDECGTPNDQLKAAALGLTSYTATHARGCASRNGRRCDCDPVLTPTTPPLPMVAPWPDAMRTAARVAARAFLAEQADKKAAVMRGGGWEERELTRMLMEAYDQGVAYMAHMLGVAAPDSGGEA